MQSHRRSRLRAAIGSNIERHQSLIEAAVALGAETIVFPELSLTGYEPLLAKELAMDVGDCRLDVFQTLSDTGRITIGVGSDEMRDWRLH